MLAVNDPLPGKIFGGVLFEVVRFVKDIFFGWHRWQDGHTYVWHQHDRKPKNHPIGKPQNDPPISVMPEWYTTFLIDPHWVVWSGLSATIIPINTVNYLYIISKKGTQID